jgi:hypothetical protein
MDELLPNRARFPISQWKNGEGRLHSQATLEKSGIKITDDLIALTTEDGQLVYPEAQFTFSLGENGRRVVTPSKRILAVWNNLLKPAVRNGVVFEWSAAAFLLQPQGEIPDVPSLATTLASPYASPDQIDEVWQRIYDALEEWRQLSTSTDRQPIFDESHKGAHFAKDGS